MLFTACNKDSSISKDPVYIKMIGKWVECGNKSSTIEFRKNGQINIDRLVERNYCYFPVEIIDGGEDSDFPNWNSYVFVIYEDEMKKFSFYSINENCDSMFWSYGTIITNSTSSYDQIIYTKE